MWFNNSSQAEKSIAERSADVLNSFKQTVTSLEEINNEVETIVASNEDTIQNLQKENLELAGVASKNANVIANINKLMGV